MVTATRIHTQCVLFTKHISFYNLILGKQPTNIQVAPAVMHFSPVKKTNTCKSFTRLSAVPVTGDPKEPYESAEDLNSDSELSDLVCSDADSDSISPVEEDEVSAADEHNLETHLNPPNYIYHINNFKPLPKETFLGASSFAFEVECQVSVKSEAEMSGCCN